MVCNSRKCVNFAKENESNTFLQIFSRDLLLCVALAVSRLYAKRVERFSLLAFGRIFLPLPIAYLTLQR